MQLNSLIDHTLLKPTIRVAEVEQLCAEAAAHQFFSVCVPPPFVNLALQKLQGSPVKVCTVIGFPFGYSCVEAKAAEMVMACLDGADELDLVANIAAIKNADWQYLAGEITTLLPLAQARGKKVKLIIESGELTEEEIVLCCELYGPSGIDFLKTSTGYASKGATEEAVRLFRQHLPAHVGIKASGGIRDFATAKRMVEAGATRLGCSASVAIVQGQAPETTTSY